MKRVDLLKQVSSGVILACALAVLTPTVAPAQEAPPRPFLRKVIQLDDAQLATPAKVEDLKGLTHPPDDIAALKKCKPGSCDVKLDRLAAAR